MANAPVDPSSGTITVTSRPPRLPRWTRQEILVLIEGKRMVERRGRGRVGPGLGQPGPVEPKWAAVSAYCKKNGVNRGPVQCRKRWSNLAGDYKKIKEWERGDKNESFWGMRNDLRREKRLPGFFDREVYDILDGGGGGGVGGSKVEVEEEDEEEKEKDMDIEEERKVKAIEGEEKASESGKRDSLFEDEEDQEVEAREATTADIQVALPVLAAVPISGSCSYPSDGKYEVTPTTLESNLIASIRLQEQGPALEIKRAADTERRYEPVQPAGSSEQGTSKEKQPTDDQGTDLPSHEGHKRRRTAEDERDEIDHHTQLLQLLERNNRMVAAQLEAQNINLQLDRDQRKEQTNSFLGVLNKLADSLSKIADKL